MTRQNISYRLTTNDQIANLERLANHASHYLGKTIEDRDSPSEKFPSDSIGHVLNSYIRLGTALAVYTGQTNLKNIDREGDTKFQRYLLQYHIGLRATQELALGKGDQVVENDRMVEHLLVDRIDRNCDYTDLKLETTFLAEHGRYDQILEAIEHIKEHYPEPKITKRGQAKDLLLSAIGKIISSANKFIKKS